jgi:hypothetical protein
MRQPKYNWTNLAAFYLLEWTTGWKSLRSYC